MTRLVIPALAASAILTGLASGQVIHRFDMGKDFTAVAPGFTQVTPATTFNANLGFGWVGAAPTGGAGNVHADLPHNLPLDLIQDSVGSETPFTFRQTGLAPGTYACVAYLGQLGTPPRIKTPMYGMNITVNEGAANGFVINDVSARLLRTKADIDLAWGGFKRVSFLASPTPDGNLYFKFGHSDLGEAASLMGLEIYEYTEPPLTFDHATNKLVATDGYAELAPFLHEFQETYDYGAAKAQLAGVSDLAKAWGYAWLVGWLTGEEADADLALLDEIEDLLLGQQQDLWPVVSLLADLKDFRLGVQLLRACGYSATAVTPNLGGILHNLNGGLYLLEQVQDDVLDLQASSHRPEAPLYPKAAYLRARNMYSRNTKVFGVSYVQDRFNDEWVDILRKLWLRIDPAAPPGTRIFPRCAEAGVLAWYVQTHVPGPADPYDSDGPGPLLPWDGSVPPTFAPRWWAALTDFPADSAPEWAKYQRHYARMMRNLAGWWSERRLIGNEIGGGGGDDVEAVAVLGAPLIAKTEGPGHRVEGFVRTVLDGVLFGPSVCPEEGFVNPSLSGGCQGCGAVMDPEHAGEFTTYPLFYLMPTLYGDPRYVEYAMRTIRNLDEPPGACGDTKWTDFPGGWSTRRHFRAFRLGAFGCQASVDMGTTELMKDIIPGFTLIDYSGSQKTNDLWYELAQGWAQVAMHPVIQPVPYGLPKPDGLFPVGVRFSNGEMGQNGQWWYNDPLVLQNGGAFGLFNYDLYYMLLIAYRNSSAGDRDLLLEPIDAALELLRTTTPDASFPQGTPEWCMSIIKDDLADIALLARPELTGLNWTPAMLDQIISAHGSTYAKYLNMGSGTKDKTSITHLFSDGAKWLQNFWPLATTTVSYTDRVQFAPGTPPTDWMDENPMRLLYTTMSGASRYSFTPTFPVSWSQPASQFDLLDPNDPYAIGTDVAILVNELHEDAGTGDVALKVLLFNFENHAVQLDMRVWRGLPRGTYKVKFGKDSNEDDERDPPFPLEENFPTFERTGRDDTLPITLPAGDLYVLDLELAAPNTDPVPNLSDPGIGPEDISKQGPFTISVQIHNLGILTSPAATLHLYNDNSGQSLGQAAFPTIPAPTGLNPSSVSVSIQLQQPLPLPIRVRAELSLPSGTQQITTLNDIAVRKFDYSAVGPGPQ